MRPLAEILVKPGTQLFDASLDEELLAADWLTSTVVPVRTRLKPKAISTFIDHVFILSQGWILQQLLYSLLLFSTYEVHRKRCISSSITNALLYSWCALFSRS